MPSFPQELSVETAHGTMRYRLADDFYVVPGTDVGRGQSDVAFYLEEEQLAVCRRQAGDAARASPNEGIGPVYRLGNQGPLAVPTGKVFVRFSERESFADHREDMEQAGFRIIQTLSHAPQAGWVEASSGGIADALGRFGALRRITGVEAVEPQMLMERQRR
jgi:hypothetical protein